MNTEKFKKSLFLTVLFAIICLLWRNGAGYELARTESRSFPLHIDGTLEVTLYSGEIRISTWEKQGVKVNIKKWVSANTESQAKKLLAKLQLDFQSSDKQLLIRQLQRGDGGFISAILNRAGLKKENPAKFILNIYVPSKVHLKLFLQKGLIAINGVRGSISLEQKSGELTVRDIQSDQVTLKLDRVDVRVDALGGDTMERANLVITGNVGKVFVLHANINRLVARLKETDGYFVGDTIREGQIESISGDLFWNGSSDQLQSLRILSETGDIHCFLAESPPFSVHAETGVGRFFGSPYWQPDKRGSGFVLDFGSSVSDVEGVYISTLLGDVYFESPWRARF